jgi:hypothetical protein
VTDPVFNGLVGLVTGLAVTGLELAPDPVKETPHSLINNPTNAASALLIGPKQALHSPPFAETGGQRHCVLEHVPNPLTIGAHSLEQADNAVVTAPAPTAHSLPATAISAAPAGTKYAKQSAQMSTFTGPAALKTEHSREL